MIKIVADRYVIEENKTEFLKIVSELIAESNKEAGCISYGIYEDMADSSHLSFIEEWADEAAIIEHTKSVHYTKMIPLLAPLCFKTGTVTRYKEV